MHIEEDQLEILNKLGIDFGKGRKWIHFQRMEPGYCPYTPDKDEVKLCIRYLEQLVKAAEIFSEAILKGIHIPGTEYEWFEEKGDWKLAMVTRDQNEIKKLPMTLQKGTLDDFAKCKTL